MESPPAGKLEGLPRDVAAADPDPLLDLPEIQGVEHDQRPSGGDRVDSAQPAGEPAVAEAGVVRPVVGELPAEDAGVELLRGGDVGDGKLDVVDTPVLIGLARHGWLHGLPRRTGPPWTVRCRVMLNPMARPGQALAGPAGRNAGSRALTRRRRSP